MNRVVYKYPMGEPLLTIDTLGSDPEVVHVAIPKIDAATGVELPLEMQVPTLWIEQDEMGPATSRAYRYFGTGHPIGARTGGVEQGYSHVGSVITREGYVLHVYEVQF